MKKDLSSKKDFEKSTERKKQERKEIIRNLSKEGKRRLAEFKDQKKRAVREARKAQKRSYTDDLAKERKNLIEKKPKLELLPPGKIQEKKRKAIERQAIRNVSDANSKEISNLGKKYDQEIDMFLATERINMKETFKEKAHPDEGRERFQ